MNNKLLYVVVVAVILSLALQVFSVFGRGTTFGAEGDTGFTNVVTTGYVTVGTDLTVGDDLTVTGDIIVDESSVLLAPTSISATTTLTSATNGTTYYLSASGTTIILPAVAAGLNYRFVINGAADTGNFIIDSAEGDNIEGTLIVAGAVVDCDAEDQLNFVVDGENLGDYVEVRSDGLQWLIGDSGVLTAGKLTCTDPS